LVPGRLELPFGAGSGWPIGQTISRCSPGRRTRCASIQSVRSGHV